MPENNPFEDGKDAANADGKPKVVPTELKLVISEDVTPKEIDEAGKREPGDKTAVTQTRYVRIKSVTDRYGTIFVCSLVQVTKAAIVVLCLLTTMLYMGSSVCFGEQPGAPPAVFFPITLLCVCLFACIQYIAHGCGFGSAKRRLYGIVDITITSILAICAVTATIVTTIQCEPSFTSTAITVTIGYIISLVLVISAVVTYFKVIRRTPATPEQVEVATVLSTVAP